MNQPISALKLANFFSNEIICVLVCFLTLNNVGLYYIETTKLICTVSKWSGYYIIETSVMKDLKKFIASYKNN